MSQATAVNPVRASGVSGTFRPEIEGLRAVAVLLVAGYHIWLGRVSGGVDVFLMLTGFLITGSLLRAAERDGTVRPAAIIAFLSRLARRLLPAAALVLLAVLTASLLWLPRARWYDTVAEVVASALQFENWRLAIDSVDYLANSTAASPVQHYWSLSIQWQFYLLWPLLLMLAITAGRRLGWRPRAACWWVAGSVFATSLAYSIVKTAADQRWAYFDTGTRLWEFAFGALLFLALPYLRSSRIVRLALGWFGLAALLACGLVLQVSTVFPGYAALWPVAAAACVIVAGGADRLFTSRPLAYAGRISYALYLWHWPILIFYLIWLPAPVPSLLDGVLVLTASFVLASATTWLTDRIGRPRTLVRSFVIGLACLLPVLAVSGGWSAVLAEREARQSANAPWAVTDDLVPDPAVAPRDRPLPFENGCQQGTDPGQDWVQTCTFGAEPALRRIAIVGDSHAAQWFTAFHELADDNGWSVTNITKGACSLSTEPVLYLDKPYPSCSRWREGVMAKLRGLRPDLVVTTATATNAWGESEKTPAGYVERWKQLNDMGIDVLAIRDNPRWPYEVPECVDTRGASACVSDVYDTLAVTPPYLGYRDIPPNVTFLDLTDVWCPDGRCPTVFDNVLAYADRGHFTATFLRYKAPIIEREVKRALGW